VLMSFKPNRFSSNITSLFYLEKWGHVSKRQYYKNSKNMMQCIKNIFYILHVDLSMLHIPLCTLNEGFRLTTLTGLFMVLLGYFKRIHED